MASLDLNNFLETALNQNGFDVSIDFKEKIILYLTLLAKWNRVFNLTAIEDMQDMVMLHILDSLAVSSYLKGECIIDIGTGAGLPGIPLALLFPERNFYLLDSNNKKTRFLAQVVYELKIKNVNVVHSRSEDFHPEFCFDTIITRAFASMKSMLDSTQHLLCEQGEFLAMKGVYPDSEIKDIPEQFKINSTHRLQIKGLNAERHLVSIIKSIKKI